LNTSPSTVRKWEQGHGIQTPALVLDAMQRNLRWFNKWLAAD
jgi:DNA-binding transcriptional regulator YiaG